MDTPIEIHTCTSPEDFNQAIQLTKDYMQWLGIDLCFQNIDEELEIFPDMYGEPTGMFLLAKQEHELVGGVGLRKLDENTCEMKRLFLYPEHKGQGIGFKLCTEIILHAKTLGYTYMKLDTVAKLKQANKLYERLGFYDIASYNVNPDPTVRYMEIKL